MIAPENVERLALLFSWINGDAPIANPTFSPDGSWLAVKTADNILLLRNLGANVSVTALPDSAEFRGMAFSPDGSMLAAVNGDGTINFWQVADSSLARTLELSSAISKQRALTDVDTDDFDSISKTLFSSDGRLLAVMGRVNVWLLQIADGQLVHTLSPQTVSWDDKNSAVQSISANGLIANGMAFSPDGRWLAVAGEYGVVSIWQVSDGTLHQAVNFWEPAPVRGVAFSPIGDLLVTVGVQLDFLHVPDLAPVPFSEDFTDTYLFEVYPEQPTLAKVAFSPDGRMIIVSPLQNAKMTFWQVSDGKYLHAQQFSSVNGLALSPDGTLLAVAIEDSLQLWGIPKP